MEKRREVALNGRSAAWPELAAKQVGFGVLAVGAIGGWLFDRAPGRHQYGYPRGLEG